MTRRMIVLEEHRDYTVFVWKDDLDDMMDVIEGDVEDTMGWRCYAETLKKEGFKLREVK